MTIREFLDLTFNGMIFFTKQERKIIEEDMNE